MGSEDRSIKPWTGRPNVFNRGLPRQIRSLNFCHETLDVRIAMTLKQLDLAWDAPLPKGIVTDVRNSVYRQLAKGRFCMVANSVPFLHDKDRVYIVHEIVRHFGWGSDVAIEDLHIGFPELKEFGMINSLSQIKSSRGAVAPEPKPAAKKRRVTSEPSSRKNIIVQPYRTKTLDLMGNAMDLADESCVLYPLYLATDSIWKKPLVFPHDKEFKKPKRDMWFECKFDTTSSSASFNAHVREQMTRLGESDQIDDEDPCSD